MSMKEWLHRLQPAPLHTILFLSVAQFVAEMVIFHVTHSLTLLVDSSHMLCNIIALVGCIMTLKYDSETDNKNESTSVSECQKSDKSGSGEIQVEESEKPLSKSIDERRLRNTFGWTRIEILMMLVVCVFFGSLCFSIVVEALQTLVHIDHMDAMHSPLVVLLLGVISLLLNGFCYLLIGGYTFHQGSFLYVTASGDVVLDSVATATSISQGQRRISRSKRSLNMPIPPTRQRQGTLEAIKDIISCVFVIICSFIVYATEPEIAKFVDPSIAILSVFVLMYLTYPYLKESGLILLQTIPDTMNIDTLKADLLKSFPDIINIHDFHVWQLTTSKVVITVHIVFLNPMDFIRLHDEIKEFLLEQGMTLVTIQPEFINENYSIDQECIIEGCLMKCKNKSCITKNCCTDKKENNDTELAEVVTVDKPTSSSQSSISDNKDCKELCE